MAYDTLNLGRVYGSDGLTQAQVDARVVAGITGKQDTLTFDADPVAESSNPVTSGGVFSALAGKQDILKNAALRAPAWLAMTVAGITVALIAYGFGDRIMSLFIGE